jgi:hypothetical protein
LKLLDTTYSHHHYSPYLLEEVEYLFGRSIEVLHTYHLVVDEGVLSEVRKVSVPEILKALAIEALLQLVHEVDFEAQAGALVLFAGDLALLDQAAFSLSNAALAGMSLALR